MSATATRTLYAKARTRIERPRDLLLILRMLGWGLALRALKHGVPLPTLVRLARWRQPVRADAHTRDEHEKVVTLARWACRPMPWSDRGTCLERSLVTFRYLTPLNAHPTLVVGMAPRTSEVDLILGHVWVVVDDHPLGGTAASLSDFHVVMTFDADGRRLTA